VPVVNVTLAGDDPDPNLQQWIDSIGVYVPDEYEDRLIPTFQRMADGCCMLCGGELNADAIMMIQRGHIVMLFCTTLCMTDQHVLGYLEEKVSDHITAIEFRGGKHGSH
jgi:hypothetical protein